MRSKIAHLRERLLSTFWLLPLLISSFLIFLNIGLKFADQPAIREIVGKILNLDASGDGGRMILSAIATAAMTVVGVLFSITVVVLQQVSSQYTPRVIENFIRSWFTQTVLGVYIGRCPTNS